MKKIYLVLLTALSFTVASAQFVTPMNASTVAELKEVEWTFPGLRNATTKVRYWISPTEVGFEAAFSFNIVRDANNNVTSMVTTDINNNNPPATKFSSIGVVNGNKLNVQVKTADPQTADPFVDFQKETIFKNALGKDSLVVIDRLNSQNQYDEYRRIQLVYNANGAIIALKELLPSSNNYELVGYRNFGYIGSKRVTDTTYIVGQVVDQVVAYNKLFYTATDKLDSVLSFSVKQGVASIDAGYRMYYDATPGIAKILVTSVTPTDTSFEYRIDYIGSVITASNENNLLNENNFVCYPVPANNELNVTANNGESYSYTLFDIYGNKITSVNLSNQATINTVNMASGVYLLNIQDSNGNSTTKKITIQH
jgi:hypothetical protein